MTVLKPWPPADPITVLASTIWMEARGDGQDGMRAVANVVLNRVHHPMWWGNSILSVCLAPKQFSSWNEGSTQIALVQQSIISGDPTYLTALKIAQWAVESVLTDITGGADGYYSIDISPPFWAREEDFTVQIGRQRFFRTSSPPNIKT